jgi:hypothetical protein
MQYIGRDESRAKSFFCTICNAFFHQVSHHVRNHVESRHFPTTFTYNCPHCDKIVNTRKALQNHIYSTHKPVRQ